MASCLLSCILDRASEVVYQSIPQEVVLCPPGASAHGEHRQAGQLQGGHVPGLDAARRGRAQPGGPRSRRAGAPGVRVSGRCARRARSTAPPTSRCHSRRAVWCTGHAVRASGVRKRRLTLRRGRAQPLLNCRVPKDDARARAQLAHQTPRSRAARGVRARGAERAARRPEHGLRRAPARLGTTTVGTRPLLEETGG